MPNVTYGPSIVISKDGSQAVEIVEFIGTSGVPNHDATAFDFFVRTEPYAQPFRLSIVFSGTTLSYGEPMKAFGIPDYDRVLQFVHLSEVRLGDYLDEEGIPSPPEYDYYATQLECYSERLEEWANRKLAGDDLVDDYVKRRLLAGWTFDHDSVVFHRPDLVRLRIPSSKLTKIVEQGRDTDWSIIKSEPYAFTLKPTQGLITSMRSARPTEQAPAHTSSPAPSYVSEDRIQELRQLENPNYDLTRLTAMLEELNVCAAHRCLFAIAMLTRGILDHVPPVFGLSTFAQLANNYDGGKSFKESMHHLENSARKVGDAFLHVRIRDREVLPTVVQVNFSRELDVLLAEVVRVLKKR